MLQDDKAALVKMGIATGGTTLANVGGLTWGEWAAIATIVYAAVQTYVLVRDKVIRRRRRGDP